MKTDIKTTLRDTVQKAIRFKATLFVIVVAATYGFIVWRASDLANVQADQNAVSKQTSTLQPHIDPATIQKIKELQDNSVNVRSLFDQSRQNPFKE